LSYASRLTNQNRKLLFASYKRAAKISQKQKPLMVIPLLKFVNNYFLYFCVERFAYWFSMCRKIL